MLIIPENMNNTNQVCNLRGKTDKCGHRNEDKRGTDEKEGKSWRKGDCGKTWKDPEGGGGGEERQRQKERKSDESEVLTLETFKSVPTDTSCTYL